MDTYSLLREIADSWVLLAMFIFFIGVIVWAFWPSQHGERVAASMIPFAHDTAPKSSCTGDCATCPCAVAEETSDA